MVGTCNGVFEAMRLPPVDAPRFMPPDGGGGGDEARRCIGCRHCSEPPDGGDWCWCGLFRTWTQRGEPECGRFEP